MASGMKSFLLDCLDSDGLHSIIEVDYGIKGWAIIIKLRQRIHSTGGYYCIWNDRVARVFASDNAKVSAGLVQEVVSAALTEECGIFDKGMYEKYGILTSAECQQSWYEYAKRRKVVFDKPEYVLPDCASFLESADNSGKNASKKGKNASNSDTIQFNTIQDNGSEGNATPPPAPLPDRNSLVQQYGERAVKQYELKYQDWQQRKNIYGGISYPEIAKWMLQDGVPDATASSADIEELMDEIRAQYQ